MKKLLLFCIVLISLVACKKDSNSLSQGKIIGYDYRKCASPCCGGFYIQIDNATYRCLEVPDNSQLNLSEETLPLNVIVGWKKVETSCGDDLISIDYMRKRIDH